MWSICFGLESTELYTSAVWFIGCHISKRIRPVGLTLISTHKINTKLSTGFQKCINEICRIIICFSLLGWF